jgi:hypothetical protein
MGRDLSEELVQDLGVRDELEFEKVRKGRSYWSAGNSFVL